MPWLFLVDCWDGPSQPIVYHGRTLTSKILFSDVVATINEHAFTTSPYVSQLFVCLFIYYECLYAIFISCDLFQFICFSTTCCKMQRWKLLRLNLYHKKIFNWFLDKKRDFSHWGHISMRFVDKLWMYKNVIF